MEKNEYTGADIKAMFIQALEEYEGRKKVVILNRAAVAKRLHVSKSTLWRWDCSGYLKAVRCGRALWYREEDVERLERGELVENGGGHKDE